jgi:DNA-binding NarL/FixJ family response regulator
MNEKIKVVIADDHVHFRRGIAATINEDSCMEVIAQAGDAAELVEIAQLHQADVIITDLVMPGNGLTAIRQLMARGFNRIIVVTGFEEEESILEALEAGALGYVAKIADSGEIITAILQVYRYRPHCSDSTSPLLMKEMAKSSYNPYKKLKPLNFDEKELEIIKLTCFDKRIEEIAAMTYLSERKVSRIRKDLIERTEVSGRFGLLFYALKTGIVSLNDFP